MSAWAPANDTTYPADTVAYTGTAGITDALWNAGPSKLMVFCTSAAYVRVGEAGAVTATTSSTPVPANTPVIIEIPQGTGAPFLVSAVQIAAGGDLYAKPGELVP